MPMGFPATPAVNDTWPAVNPQWIWDGTEWEPISQTPEVPVGTALATTGTVNLDFLLLKNTIQVITLTGNLTFTASNMAAGRKIELTLNSGGTARTLAWPGFRAFGAALPTSLAATGAGSSVKVALEALGTTAGSVDVAATLVV
jgi:hypothetical protein